MPLKQGSSEETISANIKELINAGHSPEQAAAIAYKEAGISKDDKKMMYYGTRLSDNITETPEGYLIAHDTIIARTGEQLYGANEVPVETDKTTVMVQRDMEEVTRPETLASFEGKPLTAGHPEDFVTPDNWNDLAMGFVTNVRAKQSEEDENLHFIIADVMITNAKAIQAVKDGLRELSCGYEADYVDNGDGTGRQVGILGNHVALVPQGRCGSACAIKDQSYKGGFMGMKEKLIDALSAIFDDATIEAENATEAKEEDTKTIDADASLTSLIAKIDELSAKVDKLIGMEEAEAETEDAEEETPQEEEGAVADADSKEEEMTADADTISRAEILAAGCVKTGDVKTTALEMFAATVEGQEVIKSLNGLTGDALFVAASEVMKLKRSASFKREYNDAVNDSKPITASDINAKAQEYWAKNK